MIACWHHQDWGVYVKCLLTPYLHADLLLPMPHLLAVPPWKGQELTKLAGEG